MQPVRDELREFGRAAAPKLDFAPLWFDDAKRQAIGESIARVIRDTGYTVWACAVLRNHVHLCVRRHRDAGELICRTFADSTAAELRRFAPLPANHPVWSQRPYKVYLYTPDDVRRVIAYIENNPVKEGLARQTWEYVTPYTGWPHPNQSRQRPADP